jgi:hypothetical protein
MNDSSSHTESDVTLTAREFSLLLRTLVNLEGLHETPLHGTLDDATRHKVDESLRTGRGYESAIQLFQSVRHNDAAVDYLARRLKPNLLE